MVLKSHPLKSDFFTTSPTGEGLDLSYAEHIWTKVAQSECRIEMLSTLTKLKIGLREVQDYSDSLQLKLKSDSFKSNIEQNIERVIMGAMSLKLRDEKCYCGELYAKSDAVRREMRQSFGENTRQTRTIIKHLRNEAARERTYQRMRYCKKLDYLREKYANCAREKLDEVPEELREYEDAAVFNGEKFAKIEEDEVKIQIVGNVLLSENERKVLRLHPKFALMSDMSDEEMDFEMELCFAKIRYQLSRELGEKLSDEDEAMLKREFTAEEEEKMEEDEAKSRQVFDPEGKYFDNRKKRATDLSENSRVCLPKPLPAIEEASIEVRRENIKRVFVEIKKKLCNKKNQQKSNLTRDEEEGLASVRKRIKNEEIIIMKTEKSGKFAVTGRETMKKWGNLTRGRIG